MGNDTITYDRNFGALVRDKTQSNITVKKVYGPDDIKGFNYEGALGNPGGVPFTRGIYPDMYFASFRMYF